MTEKITYIAFDGTEFTDEVSCLEYEMKLHQETFTNELYLLDYDFSIIPFTIEGYENCKYIYILSDAAAASLRKILRDDGYETYPDGKGIFAWDYNQDLWENLEEKYVNMSTSLLDLEGILDQIRKAVPHD